MFSRRLHWDLRPNRLSELIREKRLAGAPILDLTESNPTRAGLSYPSAEILAALAGGASLAYEPLPAGSLDARAAVAAYYRERGHSVPVDRIVLTASTSESYAWLFKLLCDPGDEVLVPRPSYPLFEFLAALESARVVQYRLAYHGSWSVDLDSLRQAVTPRTRAIIVVNPNNPTGSFLKRSELQCLLRLASGRSIAIISDEVFADYGHAPDARRVTTLAGVEEALAFSLSGLSKIAGLPQMKLGWMVLSGPPDLRDGARERLELIADTYLSIGTPVQQAAAALVQAGARVREQIRARIADNAAALRAAAGAAPSCEALHVEGGWYATVRVPRTRTEEEWCLDLLDRDGVLVQPGFFYDFETEAFLVLSLLTPEANFREGVRRLFLRAG